MRSRELTWIKAQQMRPREARGRIPSRAMRHGRPRSRPEDRGPEIEPRDQGPEIKTMNMRTIFVPWWASNASEAALETALAIARRVEGHLDVVFIQPDPAYLTAVLLGTGFNPAGMAEQVCRLGREGTEGAQVRFAAWRERHGVSADIVHGQLRSTFARWSERAGLPEQVIVRKGRLSDLTVLGFPDPTGALDRPLDAALFETGRPVLLVPREGHLDPLRHAAVAWNGSLEATRAISGAMPLLYRAERVTVFTTPGLADSAFVNDDARADLDLCGALEWHGIRAQHVRIAADAGSAGGTLLQAAAERDATLLVMGAYTHSRVTAAFLGGMTGHVLQHPPAIPVLLGH